MKLTYLLSDYKGIKFRDVFAKNVNKMQDNLMDNIC